ncbi:von willebrand factor a domain-containing protein 5a [Anaeramoeba ignava]|uniref:von willebrand factor a domain-containing protein 5a n=1 Tax=Anaeramoeba ignava TaxID=1746090 RepID=A0A9Q0LRL7_ANAIG|nr:von willebrand factor a domain-containing protein 5a [Anaeramoeba ignava]
MNKFKNLTFGLIKKNSTEKIPFKNIEIHIDIHDLIAEVILTQTFENNEENPIEISYTFPKNPELGICGLEVNLEGKKLYGKVYDKEKTEEKYNDGIAQGKLVFKTSEVEDFFEMGIGNLSPGKKCEIVLHYLTELKFDEDSGIKFSLQKIPIIQQKDDQNSTIITVNVEMDSEIEKIISPSHKIKTTIRNNKAKMELSEEENKSKILDKKFVLKIYLFEPHKPRVIIEEKDEKFAFLASLYPKFQSNQIRQEMLFIVDRSGSMNGEPIKSVSQALISFLHALPPNCFFNILGFGSQFHFLFPQFMMYDQDSLEKAIEYAKNMRANFGGTELLHPLTQVFNQEIKEGYSRQIFLLTDGNISQNQEVFDLIKRRSNETRIFTFGIGRNVSKELVSGIAKFGGGSSEFIIKNEDIQLKVMRQLNKALKPALTNIEFQWEGIEPLMIFPFKKFPIYSESKFILCGFLRKLSQNAKLFIHGKNLDEKQIWEIDLDFSKIEQSKIIQTFAAKKLIFDLENKTSQFHSKDGEICQEKDQNFINNKIVKLSKKFNLVSSLTSFFIESDSGEAKQDLGEMQSIHISQKKKRFFSNLFKKPNTKSSMDVLMISPPTNFRHVSHIGYDPEEYHGRITGFETKMDQIYSDSDSDSDEWDDLDQKKEDSIIQINQPEIPSLQQNQFDFVSTKPPLPPKIKPNEIFMNKPKPPKQKPNEIFMNKPKPPIPIKTNQKFQKKSILTKQEKLNEIINLQKANGCWEFSNELIQLLGFDSKKIKENLPDEKFDLNIWISFIVLNFLNLNFQDKEVVWRLIGIKSRNFIEQNLDLGKYSFEKILELGKKFIIESTKK